MDLNDAERYAVAALFTLALHSTHVESGVDKSGNSLSESDIAWGCPSEELFDEQLLSQVPLKLPPELLDIFWGFDCMAPAGLAPRLYAWLKVPRKAWPGLLRMPDLAGCAGSAEAVEAFVTLVRRYSAFLDPELDFVVGQANRLQQHFSMPDAVAGSKQDEQQQQHLDEHSEGLAAADSYNLQTATATSKQQPSFSADQQSMLQHQATQARLQTPCVSANEAVAAAAATLSAVAIAAEASDLDSTDTSTSARTALPSRQLPGRATSDLLQSPTGTVAGKAGPPVLAAATAAEPLNQEGTTATPLSPVSFAELHEAVDRLPKNAVEGTVVPAATFTPAEHYKHTTSHKAVLALYELIGGCLATNTEEDMDPLFAMAAQEAKTAEFAAAAAKGNKKALQQFVQQQQQRAAATAAAGPVQQQGTPAEDSNGARPAAAWFPEADSCSISANSSSNPTATEGQPAAAAAASASTGSRQRQKQPLQQLDDSKQSEQQLQQLQGLAAVQWYDARSRVAVKRVAHWLRVPWPQVRAFEHMWAAQALSLDAASAQPKYESSSRAMQYLKVGAAAVGGGALLAVTGGLAAPAIAAGLGAAVTLAHGGAAVAAAVSGFAGSTAGTAAVTGLFGAWGASVGGGSARTLYGEVTEFGFWDLSQSIFIDGRGPEQHDKASDPECSDQPAQQEPAASPLSVAEPAADKLGSSLQAAQPQPYKAGAAAAAASMLPEQQPTQQQGDCQAPAPPSRHQSQPPPQQQQQQQQVSCPQQLISPELEKSAAQFTSPALSTKHAAPEGQVKEAAQGCEASEATASHLGLASASRSASQGTLAGPTPGSTTAKQPHCKLALPDQQEEGLAHSSTQQQLGSDCKAVPGVPLGGCSKLGESSSQCAADTSCDADAGPPTAHTGQQVSHQTLQQDHAVQSETPQQQQQQQQPAMGEGSTTQTAESALGPAEELKAVVTQQDPLRSLAAEEQPANLCKSASTANTCQHQKDRPVQQQEHPQAKKCPYDTASAAACSLPGSPVKGTTSTAQSTSGVLSGMFSRKPAPPPPIHVPLLPTPINSKHKDETRMALTIAVNGCCIESTEDFARPWQHLPCGDCDRFALVWESACLKELGRAVVSFLAQQALTQVAQKSIQTFLYTGLVGALALPMTLTTAMQVAFGSKWLVALRRAQAAGKMLALLLAQGCHGGRPVTLIGCSMGARLVYHCLLELARLGLRGCVENVILLGAPVSCRPDRWCAVRSVVAGRLINGYSVNDWTLGLLYRVHSSSSIWLQAAGMYRVEVPGVENINLSRLVAAHQDYLTVMDDILDAINMHDA